MLLAALQNLMVKTLAEDHTPWSLDMEQAGTGPEAPPCELASTAAGVLQATMKEKSSQQHHPAVNSELQNSCLA